MKRILIITLTIFHFPLSIFGQGPPKAPPAKSVPKLVVGVVVDQMRYDFIYRYWNKYGDGGFKKLLGEGFFCRNTNYNYMPTFTGPGHASIYTGTTPSVHGIIANNWYSRENKGMVYCSGDKKVQPVGTGSPAGQMSPRNMLTTTICDELRLSNNMRSKVIGIAMKDRGAILPAGHSANAAYWYDKATGNWITSTHYMKNLPDWVIGFNKKELAKSYLSKPWTTLLPIEQYTESTADDNKYEEKFSGETAPVFPHNLPELAKYNDGPALLFSTPFGNSFTKDFAIETIKAENMGKGEFTDFLALSFSSTDIVGHQFGVNAIETEDTYLRLDKDIAELLKFLDDHLGRHNYLLFLTADHGAVENPQYLNDMKLPGGFVSMKAPLDSLKRALFKLYGDSLLLNYSNQQIYLKQNVLDQRKMNVLGIERAVADYMLRFNGVAGTMTATALSNNDFTTGHNRLLQNGFHPKRSGDVLLNFYPGYIEHAKTGTTHGAPYSYDTHVPLIWFGATVKNGSSDAPVDITDIAPTVAMFLNIQFPSGCTGKPIQGLER